MTFCVNEIPVGVAWFLALELLRMNFLVELPREGAGLTSFEPILVNGRGRATNLDSISLTSDA